MRRPWSALGRSATKKRKKKKRNTNISSQLKRFREMYFLLGIPKNYSIQNSKIYKSQMSLKIGVNIFSP